MNTSTLILLLMMMYVSGLNGEKETMDYWTKRGMDDLQRAIGIHDRLNKNYAKNIVLLIGDGMSLGTTVAGRIKSGQDLGGSGEDFVSELDKMPHVGLAKTYSVDNQVPDSAATATAIMTGVKTDSGRLGVDARGSSCWSSKQYRVQSALHKAIAQGKSVGIVTTTRVQHATPAASYAHVATRNWYSDDNLRPVHKDGGCKDIAQQLYDLRHSIQVILGGGRAHMTPRTKRPDGSRRNGRRKDGQDLIGMWREEMASKNGRYVYDKDGFNKIDPANTDYLMGLFADYELGFALNRKHWSKQPSLSEMTAKAIAILSKNPKGFFLLVESGMIDKSHHAGRASYALSEYQELTSSLAKARSMTSSDETLIIATSDHGHVFTFGGKSLRGNPILGRANEMAKDGLAYTTVSYANGPGYLATRKVPHHSVEKFKYYKPAATVPLQAESHSGEDVAIFSAGPHAHLLHGVHEQSYIAQVMFYASCLGPEHMHWPHCPPELALMGKNFALEEIDEEARAFQAENAELLFPGDTPITVDGIH